MIRSIRDIVVLLFGLMSLTLQAQDTIMLQSVDVTAEKIGVEVLKPLVAKKLDTLVLQSKSTSSLAELLIQHLRPGRRFDGFVSRHDGQPYLGALEWLPTQCAYAWSGRFQHHSCLLG